MGKQSGFLFYVPAWNTSKMDPVTGFVNLLDTRYENIEKAKSFFSKFDSIRYNATKGYFEFELDYNKFTTKAEGTKTKWIVCSYGTRIDTFRNPEKNNEWDNREINITDEFLKFFEGIAHDPIAIQQFISNQTDKSFFEHLLHLLKLTLQMRNSITDTEIDYLISPVANENGEFYNSENEKNKGKDKNGNWLSGLPVDADANGAFNIARKGLLLLNRLNNIGVQDFEKTKKVDNDGKTQWLPNKEWLKFIQQQ